jgi:threonine dehydratase
VKTVRAGRPLSSSLPDPVLLSRARTLRARFPMIEPATLVRMPQALAFVESGQVTGSFKVRGALLALEAIGKGQRVVAASAGNHGAGVAFAAKELGLSATIVVPRSAPRAKTEKMEQCGATVVRVVSDSYDDAEREAKALADREGATFVSPYDDLAVLAGNGASLAYELARLLPAPPSIVIVPFGGGGLATGLAIGLADAYGDTLGETRRVWGAQSDASSAMASSLERGAAIEYLPCEHPTFAEGLEGGISRAAFERAAGVIAGVVVVDERSIARAMVFANDQMGLRIEGSAAVGLAAVQSGWPSGEGAVVVLTGRNVDDDRFDLARAAAVL